MARRYIQRLARNFEDDIARDLGGQRVPLSGAGLTKADVRKSATFFTDDTGVVMRTNALTFRVEAKTTWRAVYTFRRSDWDDLVRAADSAGEHPVFAVRFRAEQDELAIARTALLAECGLGPTLAVLPRIEMRRALRLHPYTTGRLALLRLTEFTSSIEELVILPYLTFLERIQRHELYAPIKQQDDPDASHD